MDKRAFRVLDGGLAHCPGADYREIHSCWVTNTRLMGVLVLCVRWKNVDPAGGDLYHFFYYDYEEYGLNRFEAYAGGDHRRLAELENDLIGGLGGRKVAIRTKEALFLLQGFLQDNRRRHIEMPGDYRLYGFYQEMDGALSPEEEARLWRKTCVEIETLNGVANYFLMRCFGRDFAGAALLAEEGVEPDLFPEFPAGTFFRNKVILSVEHQGCQCRSLVETAGGMFLVVTELDFRGMCVAAYRRRTVMPLSPEESYMNLSHEEFVTAYNFHGAEEIFHRGSTAITERAVVRQEHGGRTFMIFEPDNRHVEQSTYRLHEDLIGVIHVSGGQLLASATTLRKVHRLEIALHTSQIANRLELLGAFQFLEPVFMRYLESDFQDFLAYLEAIKID